MDTSHCFSNCISCPAGPKSIFKDLDMITSKKLSENKSVTQYKTGETLFHQGAPSFGTYCIGSGKVKLCRINESGGETIFSLATSGEIIGYQDTHLHPAHLTTAAVIDGCNACFIPNEYLRQLCLSIPEVTLNLLNQTTRVMEVVSSYGHASLHMTAKNRVASLLVLLGRTFGVKSEGKIKIDLRLTRQEMASMVGTASETMIRSLSDFKHQGILEQEGNFIMIKDMEKLNHLTNTEKQFP